MTRRPLDAYYTPDDLAEALVDVLPVYRCESAHEPHAGGGAFVRALMRRGMWVYATDINPDAGGMKLADMAVCCDFLDHTPRSQVSWVVGNPPYSNAEAHVRHAIDITGRHVAFLLRLAFLESRKRVPFWREHPARKVWVLAERPSFTGGATDAAAYGWFWWDKQYTGPTELEVLSWRGR